MPRRRKHLTLAALGSVTMLTGVALLFTAALSPAQAAKRHSAPRTTASCTNQHHLNDPTTSQHQVLESYSFDIQPTAAPMFSVCDLFAHVNAGDIVTAKFTPVAGVSAALTLVSYQAPAKKAGPGQTFFDCASFGVSGDGCTSSATTALTVHVPNCGFQIDFIFGAVHQPLSTALTPGTYAGEHVWISGMAGDRSTGPCSGTGGVTSSPTPTGGVNAAVSPPVANAGGDMSLAQSLLGLTLIVLGAGAIVRSRRYREEQS